MDEETRKSLEDHKKRISKLEELVLREAGAIERGLSLNEFVLLKKSENDLDRVLVVRYFLEKHGGGLASFNAKDLRYS